jgi:hypothetical protein
MGERTVLDVQRAVGAVQRRPQPGIVLSLDEVGQHIVIAPSPAAAIAPAVEVSPIAPDIDHCID